MKKFLFLLILAAIGYSFYLQAAEKKKDQLSGSWVTEKSSSGRSMRVVMNLERNGDARLHVTATGRARSASRDLSGRWTVGNLAFMIDLTSPDPELRDLRVYGGRVVTLNEHSFSIRTPEGTETWRRL